MFDLADLASAVDHDCRNEARPYLRRAENRVLLTQKESRVKGSHTDRSPDLMKQSIRPHDVRITSVAAFVTGGQKYNPESGCCLQGNLTEECQVGHVYRLLRGSGTIKMLQRISGDANATLKHVVVARGGANYKVVDASTFIDAYFGLELMPLQSVCFTLTPEQNGAATTEGQPELCDSALRYCAELPGSLSCRARYANGDDVDIAAKPPPPPDQMTWISPM